MEIEFIGQPFPDSAQVGGLIQSALGTDSYSSAWFVTAWGKRSGLGRLARDLETFRSRGGISEVVLGVDEGGATVEGLTLASQLFDEAWIFHDPGARTFHPKMYVVQSDESATAIVGSGNMTKGGLFTNYEIAVGANLDLSDTGDASFISDARSYFDRLTESKVCKPLSESLIDELRVDPSILLQSEKESNSRRASRRGHGPDGGPSVFGSTVVADLLGAPPAGAALPGDDSDDDDRLAPPQVGAPDGGGERSDTGVTPETEHSASLLNWSKTMRRADAQTPTAAGTNPTGVLRLAQAGHRIDHRTWFRHQLFAEAEWADSVDRHKNQIEVAVVPMDVVMSGRSLGMVDIQIDHAPHREAGQNNVPTILHWGNVLGAELRKHDFNGQTVELLQLPDGYQLRIG